MDRSKSSVQLLGCAALLVALLSSLPAFSLPIADAQEKPSGVSFESIPTGYCRVEPGRCVTAFSGRHFEISFVRGRFNELATSIHCYATDSTTLTVEFTIKVQCAFTV